MGDLVLTATVLAVFIACIGLVGLASFTAEQRRREIAIRKTLGAEVSSVAFMLSRDFLKLILVAFAIASPIAWIIMNRWLEGFYYHTEISWWMLLFGGVAAILIAMCAISWQAFRAAMSNPVVGLSAA
ncbi:MAG: FtsX-like permease family protein [Pseudomonadales bacterium]|nr:FtsX-like permease family protein [Pseudomonadales bacterium]